MKIPFDIKYKPQIESGEYKVVTYDDFPARIICWDSPIDKDYPIICIVFDNQIEQYKADGRFDNNCETSNYGLFIVTPEPELNEDEKIRKEIVAFLKEGTPYYCPNSTTRQKWATWLEKKEEQKPKEPGYKHENYFCEKCQANAFNAGRESIQKEQKLAEWNKKDKENIELIAMHLDNLGNTAMAEILLNLRPQPRQEWSKEDEATLNYLIDFCNSCHNGRTRVLTGYVARELSNWLYKLKSGEISLPK